MAAMTTTGTLLALLVCVYLLMQCYLNSQAYTQYCDSSTTAASLNIINGVVALGALCLLLWSIRPTGTVAQ